MPPAPPARPAVGHGPVADLFYSGRYGDVLAATADAPEGYDPDDLAFAVGALAFAGRVVEAEILARSASRALSHRTRAAAAAFVSIAQSRGGRFDEARATLRRALRDTDRGRDAWSRALLLQAAACARFFSGRLAHALADAEAAQTSALAARFAYASMLANDLRGHAHAAVGSLALGVEVLAQARDQAARLGYHENAGVIATTIALYRARAASPAEALAILDACALAPHAQDGYSRRTLLLERAPWSAWVGRGTEALSLLDAAAPLCAIGARPRALLAVARAQVARTREGWPAALAHLDDAERALDTALDPAVRAEVMGLRLAAATALGDASRARLAEGDLARIARESGLRRARQWLAVYHRDPLGDAPPAELAVMAEGSPAAALQSGMLGLIPECAGLSPGRRLHRFDDALVVEDRGDLTRLPPLSPRASSLLAALGRGVTSREELFTTVWSLRGYSPSRHDGLLKTAASRLRTSLGPARAWLRSTPDGYALAPGVEVRGHGSERGADVAGAPLPERALNPRQRRILAAFGAASTRTVTELARALDAPQRTVSRELAAMCEASVLAREGAGRATVYRLCDASPKRG